MKQLIILIALAFTSITTSAQKRAEITLHQGNTIQGKIVERSLDGLKIRTPDGTIWSLKNDEIKKISEMNNALSKYYNHITLGMLPSDGVSGSFHVVNGYSISPRLDLGVGLGIESFFGDGYVPMFLEGKYSLFKSGTSPFVSMTSGYDFSIDEMNFTLGGYTGGVKFGIDHFFSNNFGFTTSVGYRFAYLRERWRNWDDSFTISEIHRMELRFGVIFN